MSDKSLFDFSGNVQFASEEPRHFSMMPQILDYLTYIDETIDPETQETIYTRKRLTPTEKEVYRVLKYRAGTTKCFRSTVDLAAQVGCSKNTIVEAKRALAMPFEQLEGNPLIYIEEKYVRTMEEDVCINKKCIHLISVVNIWHYNNAFLDQLDHSNPVFPKRNEEVPKEDAEIIIEKLSQDGAVNFVHNSEAHPKNEPCPEAHPKNEPCSPGGPSQNWDLNKYHINKDHCSKTDTTAEAVSRCLLNELNVDDCFFSTNKAFDWLQVFGFKEKYAQQIIKKYSLNILKLAALYVQSMSRKKTLKSLTGYFILTLQNRWYLPQPKA